LDFSINSQQRVYLITGASGFVGANLCRRLVDLGEEVHIFVRPTSSRWRLNGFESKINIHTTDLRDSEQVRQLVATIRPTIIYHLATYGGYHYQTDIEEILQVNIFGLWNLLNSCNQIEYELFVNTGSSSEYGRKQFAMRETDMLSPNSYYAVTKVAQSLFCQHFAKENDRPIVTLRLFSVFGPFEEPNRLIPKLVMATLLDKAIDMVSADTARDFIYIDDVVDAYLKIDTLHALRGEILNIGTGIQSTLAYVVKVLEEISGKKIQARWNTMPHRPWDTDIWVADRSKMQRHLGSNPKTSLREGLTQCVRWFSENQQLYK
jgi:nucleoside-diphosphate-sugar epimerase